MARARILPLLAAALVPSAAAAQTDYRNLDHGRPTTVVDAYPIEHHALEFGLGYGLEEDGDLTRHTVTPEIAWGVLPGTQVALGFPLMATGSGDRHGLEGIEGSLLFNLLTESPSLPAVAVGASVHLPVGRLAGSETGSEAALIATRSSGRWRAHLEGSIGLTNPGGTIPRWRTGFAVDRTLYRQSVLLVGGMVVSQSDRSAPDQLLAELGLRWQASPLMTLDAGFQRRLGRVGPDAGLRIGVARTFSLPRSRVARSPDRPHAARPGLTRRIDESYPPGAFNWRFLATYPEAARLFNGFDYGHAILYERLLAGRGDRLDEDYRYLTTDLLVRPPRLAVAEEAIAPNYARFARRAMEIFDWAHLLHRQIYDVLADDRLNPEEQSIAVERVTDAYLANHRLALAALPKGMQLMDEQYYSQTFRKAQPRFNALIWSYHWLQVALYEPLLAGTTASARKAGVNAAVAHFWDMTDTLERHGPEVMPMTSAVAPEFTRLHPRAAAIFDNLHMLHDIVSDILVSDQVPPNRKRGEIYRALDNFQDGTRDVMPAEHWMMMGEMMGGVDLMGGPALRPR